MMLKKERENVKVQNNRTDNKLERNDNALHDEGSQDEGLG